MLETHSHSAAQNNVYVGRFAPSPSGSLHFGSLIAALGSFLQAKKHAGKWLLRIEDIDPPREVVGASDEILRTLEQHHLYWDDAPVYQSQRSAHYEEKIAWLKQNRLTFNCRCTRAQLQASHRQLCACRQANYSPHGAAIRFNNAASPCQFDDIIQGHVNLAQSDTEAQFAIKRKDGLYAYQLAVVADDIEQGVTQVVRGADLLPATFYQLSLYRAFGVPAPSYAHLPLVMNTDGKKLSKQNHAPELDLSKVPLNLYQALCFLGMSPPLTLQSALAGEVISWAIANWDISRVPASQMYNDNRITAL